MSAYEWKFEPADDLDQTLVERMKNFPRRPDMTVYAARSLVALVVRLWLKIFHRLAFHGLENLPAEGSFILAANHSSHLDSPCLSAMFSLKKRHRVFPVAAADYFFTTTSRTLISSIFINALPFGRYANTRHSLRLCQELLSNTGNVLVIFPEGTRSATGELGRFKPGVGLLVSATKVPIVPCYIDGAFAAFSKGSWLPAPKKVRIFIGAPLRFESEEGAKAAPEDIAQKIRDAVVALRPTGPV